MTGAAFCCNCQEDFPVRVGGGFAMGQLTALFELRNPRLRERFASWRDHPEGAYLCGNCYFDLTDDDV